MKRLSDFSSGNGGDTLVFGRFDEDDAGSTLVLIKDGCRITADGIDEYFRECDAVVEVTESAFNEDRDVRTIFLAVEIGELVMEIELNLEYDEAGEQCGSVYFSIFSDNFHVEDIEIFEEKVASKIDLFGRICDLEKEASKK